MLQEVLSQNSTTNKQIKAKEMMKVIQSPPVEQRNAHETLPQFDTGQSDQKKGHGLERPSPNPY